MSFSFRKFLAYHAYTGHGSKLSRDENGPFMFAGENIQMRWFKFAIFNNVAEVPVMAFVLYPRTRSRSPRRRSRSRSRSRSASRSPARGRDAASRSRSRSRSVKRNGRGSSGD